jgi:hypothetical protein
MGIRVTARDDLTRTEQFDQFLTKLTDWNSHSTFGPRGEEAFATELFNRFTDDKGPWRMAPEEAGWAVREALGNYQNVDPNAWQSKLLFFYPWLKSNVPFWFKTIMTNPRFATAPVIGLARQRQLSGDPKAYDPRYPAGDLSAYMGKDPFTGEERRFTVPLPVKDALRAGQVIAPGPDDVTQRAETGITLVAGRENPVTRAVTDTAFTAMSEPAPAGSYRGFDVMWNKDAPRDEQFKEAFTQLGSQLVNLPGLQDAVREGFQSGHTLDYITDLAGAGFITRSESKGLSLQMNKAFYTLDRHVRAVNKALGKGNITQGEAQTKIRKFFDGYNARVDRVKAHLQAKAKALGAPPMQGGAGPSGPMQPVGPSGPMTPVATPQP